MLSVRLVLAFFDTDKIAYENRHVESMGSITLAACGVIQVAAKMI